MMSRFGNSKASVELELIGGPFHPGSEIPIRRSLSAKESFHVSEERIEIECLETYWDMGTHPNAPVRHSKITRPLCQISETLLSDTEVTSGIPYSDHLSFRLPKDAPPTINGRAAGITWYVRYSIDVVRGRDINHEEQVTLLTPPLQKPPAVLSPPKIAEQDFKQGPLFLSFSSERVFAGETLEGTVRAEMSRRVRSADIRIELECSEQAGSKWEEYIVVTDQLQERVALQAGETYEWQFHLEIPKRPTPSWATRETSVVWLVKGVLSRRMGRNVRVVKTVTVLTA